MKRIKQACVLALSLLLCLPLCSCKELDDMRDRQAVLQPDATIMWNGYTYKALSLILIDGEPNLPYDDDNPIYVTDPDVPVLLSEDFVRFELLSIGDGLFLKYVTDWSSTYYCREDRYDELESAIMAGIPMKKCYYEYFNFSSREYDTYPLTAEQRSAVYNSMHKTEKYVDYGKMIRRYVIRLYDMSEDGMFRKYICSIICSDKYTYFLELENAPKYYVVPEEYYPIFDTIMAPYWESDGMTQDEFPVR